MLWLVAAVFGAFQPDSAADDLRLLTFNLHAEQTILDPMVAVLDAADADVVALQEVSQVAYDRFEAEFADRYPYRVAGLSGGRWANLAIFSRHQIVTHTVWPVSEMRLIRAVLDVSGAPITVFNAHPTSPGSTNYDFDPRSRQIAFLLEQTRLETNPVILMGDFNTEEWSDDYAALTAEYTDTFRTLHPNRLGATYPDYSQPQAQVYARLPRWTPPVLRIDYIFHDATFETVEARVWPDSGGSDHRPLLAVVRLDPMVSNASGSITIPQ